MRIRWSRYIGVMAWAIGSAVPGVSASVDLVLSAEPNSLPVGRYVDVGLRAVSDEGTAFAGMDVVLAWDPTVLELHEVLDSGPHNWNFMFGLRPDSQADGLNDSLLDGDALFQAASFSPATATSEGLLVATFRFSAVADTPATGIVIEPSRGMYSVTQVLAPVPDGPLDVTGTLEGTTVTVASDASLSVVNLTLPAGRTGEIIVSGDIAGAETFGLMIQVELTPHGGDVGMVEFTTAPPTDIVQLGDPWPGVGTFTTYDTNMTSSGLLNGSIDDDGEFLVAPVTYSGSLSGFPVTASPDARGIWDVRLSTSAGDSWWEGLPTALYHGLLTVVALGDGNGTETIDLRDVSEFQRCFTGSVGPIDPAAYPPEPGMRCRVYDFDDDGDVDIEDHAAFGTVMLGPAP